MNKSTAEPVTYFSDSKEVSNYADRASRLVPGWADLQRMATLLVAERAPEQANVLVVGAGGGVELKAFADAHAQWRFVGVDPAKAMLDLAKVALGPMMDRVQLHEGYVDTAPEGPFDAATCLLTMHFIELEERRRTLKEIRRRLKPGAPFVMAHISFPQGEGEKDVWLSRYVAFAVSSGVKFEDAGNAAAAIKSRLPLLGPDEEQALLKDAGFTGAAVFYVGLAFRGWVAYA